MITLKKLPLTDYDKVAVMKLRDLDVKEERLLNPHGKTLRESLMFSDYLWGIYKDTTPIGVVGIKEVSRNTACVWMMGTDEVDKHPKAIFRLAKDFFKDALIRYNVVFNWVDPNNTKTIHWLERLGFTVETETMDIFQNGKPLRFFFKEAYKEGTCVESGER